MAFDQNKPIVNSGLASADVRNNFQHLKNAISHEHNFNDDNPGATTHKLDAITLIVNASTQGNISTGGAMGTLSWGTNSVAVLTQQAGLAGRLYSVKELLQELVYKSHTHSTAGIYVNCNCCNCGGG